MNAVTCSLACASIVAIGYVVSMWILDHTRFR